MERNRSLNPDAERDTYSGFVTRFCAAGIRANHHKKAEPKPRRVFQK
jgi:hypothetical protein